MSKGKESFGVEYAAIAHLLLERLLLAAKEASQTLEISAAKLELEAIPLRSVNAPTHLLYVSAIALKLANAWKRPVLDIASEIAAQLFFFNEPKYSSTNAALQNFTVKVVPPGWIHLQLTDLGTAAWLGCLAQAPPWVGRRGADGQVSRGAGEQRGSIYAEILHQLPSEAEPLDRRSQAGAWERGELFEAQYAYARCCSLLRLAHREGMIELAEPVPVRLRQKIESRAPTPQELLDNCIPWLDSDQKLRLVHPAERNLIFHLLTFVDDLYCVSRSRYQVNWEKAAITLSQVFLTFYSQCRIWGEVKTENPQLAQARLGLIVATQSLLHLLLQDLLGVPAPLEL